MLPARSPRLQGGRARSQRGCSTPPAGGARDHAAAPSALLARSDEEPTATPEAGTQGCGTGTATPTVQGRDYSKEAAEAGGCNLGNAAGFCRGTKIGPNPISGLLQLRLRRGQSAAILVQSPAESQGLNLLTLLDANQEALIAASLAFSCLLAPGGLMQRLHPKKTVKQIQQSLQTTSIGDPEETIPTS